jgi:hypothetical protein
MLWGYFIILYLKYIHPNHLFEPLLVSSGHFKVTLI